MKDQDFVGPIGVSWETTSWGHNLVIWSPFATYDSSLEISLRVLHDLSQALSYGYGLIVDLKKYLFRGLKQIWKFRTWKFAKNTKCYYNKGNIKNWMEV